MSDYNPNQFDDPNPGWTWLMNKERRDRDAVTLDSHAVRQAVDYTRVRDNIKNINPQVGGVTATYEIRRGDNDPTQILKDLTNVNDAEVIAEYLSETQNCAWYVVETRTTTTTIAAFGVPK